MRIRRVLARLFPNGVARLRATRGYLQRLRHGDGNVAVFDRIATENYWQDSESVSGGGSNLHQTAVLRRELPRVLERLGVRSLLDAPCGDFNWMRQTELPGVSYTGVDVVAPLIERAQDQFGGPDRQFLCRNIITDPLPRADAIVCRDCLSHLSYAHVFATLKTFRESGATYLLATTYPTRTSNWDIVTGSWRPINLEKRPFNFPPPIDRIVEGSTEYDGEYSDKTLAVWRLDSLVL